MKRKTTITLAALLLAAGLLVLCYPAISNLINQSHGSYAIQELRQKLEQTEDSELQAQRQRAEEYNAQLLLGASPESYDTILDMAGGMMGYISIPAIDVNLPILHGVSEEVLGKGAGHMPESAFPIGGEGNHAVITGHTGLPSAKLFTDLTELGEGDVFYIYVLSEQLAYQVDQIKVVFPSESQDLAPVPGKDYCTLVTCTPYGVNSHRLLVRGERLIQPEQPSERPAATQLHSDWLLLLICVSVGLACLLTLIIAIMLYLRCRM